MLISKRMCGNGGHPCSTFDPIVCTGCRYEWYCDMDCLVAHNDEHQEFCKNIHVCNGVEDLISKILGILASTKFENKCILMRYSTETPDEKTIHRFRVISNPTGEPFTHRGEIFRYSRTLGFDSESCVNGELTTIVNACGFMGWLFPTFGNGESSYDFFRGAQPNQT